MLAYRFLTTSLPEIRTSKLPRIHVRAECSYLFALSCRLVLMMPEKQLLPWAQAPGFPLVATAPASLAVEGATLPPHRLPPKHAP